MYDKLIDLIQTKLDMKDFELRREETGLGSLPSFRFHFSDKRFHYVRVYFDTCLFPETRRIIVTDPDNIIVRAGFSKEYIPSKYFEKQLKDMEGKIHDMILAEWDERDRKKAKRVNIIIDILYNLWKNKKG